MYVNGVEGREGVNCLKGLNLPFIAMRARAPRLRYHVNVGRFFVALNLEVIFILSMDRYNVLGKYWVKCTG